MGRRDFFDLEFSNAQTEEVYAGEVRIPRNTVMLVKRAPLYHHAPLQGKQVAIDFDGLPDAPNASPRSVTETCELPLMLQPSEPTPVRDLDISKASRYALTLI